MLSTLLIEMKSLLLSRLPFLYCSCCSIVNCSHRSQLLLCFVASKWYTMFVMVEFTSSSGALCCEAYRIFLEALYHTLDQDWRLQIRGLNPLNFLLLLSKQVLCPLLHFQQRVEHGILVVCAGGNDRSMVCWNWLIESGIAIYSIAPANLSYAIREPSPPWALCSPVANLVQIVQDGNLVTMRTWLDYMPIGNAAGTWPWIYRIRVKCSKLITSLA